MSNPFYTLFFFGDSITWGMTDRQGGWQKRISQKLHEYCKANQQTHIIDYNLGIPGNIALDVLQRFEREMENRQMEGWQKVCVFAVGTNDCQYDLAQKEVRTAEAVFKNQVREIIARARKMDVAHIAIVGLPPVDEARTIPMPNFPNLAFRNAEITEKNEILRMVCRDLDVPFIDIAKDWQNIDAAPLLDDGLHPNEQGHMRIEQQVYAVFFQKIWPDSD